MNYNWRRYNGRRWIIVLAGPVRHLEVWGLYVFCARMLTGAIIPALMHRIPSELRSESWLGEISTRMGDLLGSPRVAPPLFCILVRVGCAGPRSPSQGWVSTISSSKFIVLAPKYLIFVRAWSEKRVYCYCYYYYYYFLLWSILCRNHTSFLIGMLYQL